MKYDDQTLIKFANDELEIDLAKEIENEILVDEELKARLEIFTSTTADKIRRAQEYGRMLRHKNLNKPISKMGKVAAFAKSEQSDEIPSHIIDLIDNFELSKKENWLVKLFNNIVTKYRVRTAVISTILAAFIGFNLLPQVATKGVDFLDDSSAKISNTYVYEVRLT